MARLIPESAALYCIATFSLEAYAEVSMFTCPDCGRLFPYPHKLRGHYGKCEAHKQKMSRLYAKHFSEPFLRWWFEKKCESAQHLAELFNKKYDGYAHTRAGVIIDRARAFGIDTHGFSVRKLCPRLRKMYEGTNNVGAKGNKGYKSRLEHLAAEGITNVRQRDSVKKKIRQTMMQRYGVPSTLLLPWYKRNTGTESRPHLVVLEYLHGRGIDCVSELQGVGYNFFLAFNSELGRYFAPRPDILLPSEKVVIEVNGNRWHGDPSKFGDSEIVRTFTGPRTAKEIREYDAMRKRHIEAQGYRVCTVWASEVASGKYKEILDNFLLPKQG